MKSLLPVFLFLAAFSVVDAYNPIVAEPTQAYEVIPVEGDTYVQREYLGNLFDYPDMYELTTESSIDLKISLRQRATDEAVPFGLIIVRQNDEDGGVSEIYRLNQPVAELKSLRDSALGMTFLEGSLIEKSISPGTYRIEVSTPDNKGDYMLVIGDESSPSGFFKALGQIYKTQRHFGYTPFHMLFSSYVYYLLGIILILAGIYYTWKYRKNVRYAT